MENNKMSENVRTRLYELYCELDERYNELKQLMRCETNQHDKNVAEAYWLASLNIGIDASEYFTYNPTFRTFLENNGIMTEDCEFIEENEEE